MLKAWLWLSTASKSFMAVNLSCDYFLCPENVQRPSPQTLSLVRAELVLVWIKYSNHMSLYWSLWVKCLFLDPFKGHISISLVFHFDLSATTVIFSETQQCSCWIPERVGWYLLRSVLIQCLHWQLSVTVKESAYASDKVLVRWSVCNPLPLHYSDIWTRGLYLTICVTFG